MRQTHFLAIAAAGLVTGAKCNLPSVNVPACPRVGTINYSKSVPDKKDFPRTSIDLCYTDTKLSLTFKALDETNFFFNESQVTNDPIYEYEVMEAFIYKGTDDPSTYLEYEISPNNVTYQAFVYNPSKDRADGAPFDHFYIDDIVADGFTAQTTLDKPAKKWVSKSEIPLALFNVDAGKAKGTKWRMNFFRTVVSPDTFPDQFLGAWSVPNKASFHISKYFGNVRFV